MRSANYSPSSPFDLQINGCYGVDFNQDDLDADALHQACARLKAEGVGGILATLITEHEATMVRRLARIAELRERDPLIARMIAGFHIEGPFLNETDGYRGAHPADAIQPGNVVTMERLLDAAAGLTRLVTLAPERDPGQRVTKMLVQRGIRVSAGHTNATRDDLLAALDAGLTLFTHLGNGCPRLMDRHDNIIQRALSLADRLTLCFIVDGAHIPFFALGNYLRLAGLERSVVVTDAIAPAGLGPGNYTLARWELKIGEDMVARAPDGSHLVGAAITMAQSRANLIEKVGLSPTDADRLLCANPRKALGL